MVHCALSGCRRIFVNGNSRADNQNGMENHYQVLTPHIFDNLLTSLFRTTSCPAPSAASSSWTWMPTYRPSERWWKIMRSQDSAKQMLSAPTQTVTGSERSVVYFSELSLPFIPNFDRVFSYFDNRKGNENSMKQHRQVVKLVYAIFGQIW